MGHIRNDRRSARWPGGVIPYEIAPTVGATAPVLITGPTGALQTWPRWLPSRLSLALTSMTTSYSRLRGRPALRRSEGQAAGRASDARSRSRPRLLLCTADIRPPGRDAT